MTVTLKNNSITANSLMSNQPCTVTLSQNDKTGIKFLIGGSEIEAKVENVVSTQNCTVLGNESAKILAAGKNARPTGDAAKVVLIEHFMAALAIANIDSLQVSLTSPELPILDGSAKNWVELFNNLGLKKAENKSYVLTEPVWHIHNNTTIAVLPAEKFSVTYCIDFTNGDLNNRWVCYDDTTGGSNIEEIAEARTFGYYKDLEKFQSMGLALGVTPENTVGLLDTGYTTTLRSEYEPAKHKILDLIGDFYLTGFNPLRLKAQIIAKNAGHTSHVEVAKILKTKIREENQR